MAHRPASYLHGQFRLLDVNRLPELGSGSHARIEACGDDDPFERWQRRSGPARMGNDPVVGDEDHAHYCSPLRNLARLAARLDEPSMVIRSNDVVRRRRGATENSTAPRPYGQ